MNTHNIFNQNVTHIMKAHESMYAAIFVGTTQYVLSDLIEQGLSFDSFGFITESRLAEVIEMMDEISPCEFDSLSEFESFKNKMQKMINLPIVSEDAIVVETCNYKGEGIGFVLASEAHKYRTYVCKMDSYSQFGI